MVVTTEEARALAAHWISPADVELVRFATSHSPVRDWEEFLAEVDACRPYADANGEDARACHAELDALREYGNMRVSIIERTARETSEVSE